MPPCGHLESLSCRNGARFFFKHCETLVEDGTCFAPVVVVVTEPCQRNHLSVLREESNTNVLLEKRRATGFTYVKSSLTLQGSDATHGCHVFFA